MISVFGDSITHGGADGGWPLRVRQRLWDSGRGDQVYVQGVPGDTSANLLKRMPIELPLRPTETIIIAIGTNDAQMLNHEAYPRITDAEYQTNLDACITLAKQYARWVMLLGPYGVVAPSTDQPPAIRRITPARLATIGAIAREVAASRACRFIDLKGLLQPAHFFPDGVHPLPAGHDLVAERVWQALRDSGCLGRPETVPPWSA